MSISLHILSACSILAPIAIGAIYLKSLSFVLRILLAFVILMGVMELTAGLLNLNKINNLFVFHIYTYVEFAAILLIFFFSYDSVFWRTISIIFLIGFLIFSVINNLLFESFSDFNTNQRYLEGILVILLTTGYYMSLLKHPIHRYLERQPLFWLASGWLIYFAGTLYLFLFSKELLDTADISWWNIHAILNIGLNMIFVVSFLKGRRV